MQSLSPVPPFHLSAAIATAANNIKTKVLRDSRNDFDKFDYASADAVYAHVREALHQAGIGIWQQERKLKTMHVGEKMWVRVTYEFALTESGLPPLHGDVEKFTLMMRVNNEKSFGAMRTYALKYWLRGKFLLDTGDKADDLDSAAQSRQSVDKKPPTKPRAKSKARSTSSPRWSYDKKKDAFAVVNGEFLDETESKKGLFVLLKELVGAEADPTAFLARHKSTVDSLPEIGITALKTVAQTKETGT